MDLGLNGRTCVVTGGSRGIGYAVAEQLIAEGAKVTIVARTEARLRDAAQRLGCDYIVADLTEPGAPERVIGDAGVVDVLVNGAGSSGAITLAELTDDEWSRQWQIHVHASMAMMRAAVPQMAERGWGRVVNVSSSAGKRPSTLSVAYAVAKSGQLALSRAYADAYAASGVLINAVAPGPVTSELWLEPGGLADQAAGASGKDRDQVLEAAAAKIPLGRFGTPQEIAAVIVFLCSEPAANVAGAAWSVDGGSVATIV